ncbi:MAG: hypothetical protein ABEH83_07240 [Halobacterium sp.]
MQTEMTVRSRQAVLAVALSGMLLTAGCSGILGSNGGGGGSGGAQLNSVPADSTMVGYVDASGMVSDDSLRELANTAFQAQSENSEFYSGPTSVEELLTQMENESGLNPSNVQDVTFFAKTGEGAPTSTSEAGMIVRTDFSEDEVVSSMRDSGTELTEESYKDSTLYTYGFENQNGIAFLGDGTFVLGDTAAVKSALDVEAGDADSLSGELRTQFKNTDNGYVRFAASVPQDQVPTEQLGQGSPINTSAFNTVEYVSGSMDTSGDEVSTQVNLVSATSDDASRISDVIDGALSVYGGVGNEQIRKTLEQVEVSQDGDTVTVSFSDTVDNLKQRIEMLYSMSASGSASGSNSASASSESSMTAPLA